MYDWEWRFISLMSWMRQKMCLYLNKHHRTFLSFLMILFKRIASLMHPSALLCLAWGRDQVGEVNMNLINPWSNPSLERCTWSLSEHCLAACCIPTSIACGAFSMFCCQTRACHLCRMCESQAQGRSLENHLSPFCGAMAMFSFLSTLMYKLAAKIQEVNSRLRLKELLLEQRVFAAAQY